MAREQKQVCIDKACKALVPRTQLKNNPELSSIYLVRSLDLKLE